MVLSIRQIPLVLTFLLLFLSISSAADLKQHRPTSRDKCPVCGIFVAKYPGFTASILFRDGTSFYFDGTKDMFKFYLNLSRFAPGRKTDDITSVSVTNYYDLTAIDGITAHYVLGSEVYGPMGRELIPFASDADAREFMRDHKVKSIIRFRDINSAILKKLD